MQAGRDSENQTETLCTKSEMLVTDPKKIAQGQKVNVEKLSNQIFTCKTGQKAK